jgi:hypothetical protein
MAGSETLGKRRARARRCSDGDRRPRGSARVHAASSLAMTTVTKHSVSLIASRGSHRLRARPCPNHSSARSRSPPAAALGATQSLWGSPKRHTLVEGGRGADPLTPACFTRHTRSGVFLGACPGHTRLLAPRRRALGTVRPSHDRHRNPIVETGQSAD